MSLSIYASFFLRPDIPCLDCILQILDLLLKDQDAIIRFIASPDDFSTSRHQIFDRRLEHPDGRIYLRVLFPVRLDTFPRPAQGAVAIVVIGEGGGVLLHPSRLSVSSEHLRPP